MARAPMILTKVEITQIHKTLLQMLKQSEDWYLYHEHLEEINAPIYFHEFVERARAHGLKFLGEAQIRQMVPGNYPPEIEQVLQRLQGLPRVIAMGDFNFDLASPQYQLTTQSLDDAWVLASEGLAPAGVAVSSAGTQPSRVNPLAIRALDEVGIDIRSHTSKSVDGISPAGVDAVITLCAEEVCPVFLGKALRVHWGMPDPAAAAGSEEAKLQAFRNVRDELCRRLAIVFAQ